MDAAGVISHYVMDTSSPLSAGSDQPLTADSAGNTTFYLYGLGAIAEETNAWSYSLPDGTNTPRQLSNLTGNITLSARYTPWGDTLDTSGAGNFTFGYFGGVMDAATGLLYVGNGQYYDPATGRFLTRDVNPDSTNPYVPWNPIGGIVGPIGLIAFFSGRKKKGSKAGTFLVLLLVLGSVGMTLAACGSAPAGQVTVTATSTPGAPVEYTATFDDGLTVTGTLPASSGAATAIATSCATVEVSVPTSTSTPTPSITIPIGSVEIDPIWGSNLKDLFDAYKDDNNGFTIIDFAVLVLSGEFDPVVEFPEYNDAGFRQDLAHAATHWLYINEGEFSQNALLNWLGAMDSARTRYFGWKSSGILGGPGRGVELANYVVNLMHNPPAEWKRLDTGDYTQGNYWQGAWKPLNQEPYTWGNRSLYTVDPVAKLAELGYPPPIRFLPGQNAWYLLSLAQSNALTPYRR
jgi:RHS repeat-associated protein